MLSLKTQKIDDTHATFPKAFIDEAVLEIARREDFGFTHYGLISDAILDLMEQGSEQVAADLLEQFRLLFKTAKRFHIDSLEAMMYQVNDGLDMIWCGYLSAGSIDGAGTQGQGTVPRTYRICR